MTLLQKDEYDHNQSDTTEESDDDEPLPEGNSSTSKRRMSKKYLTYVFQSRRTIDRYLEDASYLNLHMVAERLLDKKDNVVTVGLDDTTKAAGHRMYDVKTDHITIDGPSGQRQKMKTGYVENISHSEKDGAAAYEFKLRWLVILANSSVDEIKNQVDFWMSDRAADCATLLDNMRINSNQISKCCAHIILDVDHACDKVFRDIEQKIGIQKLLKVSAGEKVLTSLSKSVHTLAQIALAKLLSPSHAAHSISLYSEYTAWMEVQGRDYTGFKGFVANRFGRIAEIAQEYLAQRQSILDFFEAVLDVNSNKLVLAFSTYIQNNWFFFDEREESFVDVSKLAYAPLTNLVCESEFAKLDNRISISGGSTSIETLSRKNVILTNRLLVDPTFTQQSSDEKRSRWNLARTSEEVANVKKLERNFIHTVKNANRLSVLKKEELKKRHLEYI